MSELCSYLCSVWSASNDESNKQFNKYQKLWQSNDIFCCYMLNNKYWVNESFFYDTFQIIKFVRVKLINCLARLIRNCWLRIAYIIMNGPHDIRIYREPVYSVQMERKCVCVCVLYTIRPVYSIWVDGIVDGNNAW